MYLMSGSLEASKIPCLLFQLLISISVDGIIVPNSTAWSRDNQALPRNPTDVIMKAGCMVLELVLFFKIKNISLLNINKLQVLINSTIEHVNILFDYKNSLFQQTSFFGGIKIHALFHTQEQILWHGIPDVTDTMTMERAHCADAVELYALSSKRNSTQIIEITSMLLERRYNALLSRRIENQDVEDSQNNVDLANYLEYTIEQRRNRRVEDDHDATNFERVNNLGKVVLVYKNTQWELQNVDDKLPLHNFVTLSDLTVMLQAYAFEEFYDANVLAQQAILALINNPNSTEFRIQLEFGIKIIPSINSGMEITIYIRYKQFC